MYCPCAILARAPLNASAPAVPVPTVANTLQLRRPYLLFLGEAGLPALAKTAFGLRDWAAEACLGQWSLPGCKVSLGLPELSPAAAAARGAGSLVIGVAPVGGRVVPSWIPTLLGAVEAGLDIVSGMHTPLSAVPGLAEAAQRRGVRLVDVRRPPADLPAGTGRKRSGKRLLTVGTDCALGKKYTALALTDALRRHGVAADFRATGQTGILIAGSGIPLDAVVADFCAGAAERLSPDAAPAHWDVIEGQGSLFHPAYAGVTLGLVHGSQPDALVLCHDPTRIGLLAMPGYATPPLAVAIERYLEAARLTNPAVRMVGIALNTSALGEAERGRLLWHTERELDLPCFDPLKTPLDAVLQRILEA